MNDDAVSRLVDPREKRYFLILLMVSLLAWLLVAVSCVGMIYAGLAAFFLWLGNGLLSARLRAEGLAVSAQQAPALHKSLEDVCGQLRLTAVPRLYVLQAGGALNAFTTRHASRNFIVISSDLLEACGAESPEVRFVLGHEIGHIRRNHILKNLLLLPGRILPLIGDAYSRACERTCDRFGAQAAGDVAGAIRAVMLLSAGREYGKSMAPEAFAAQHLQERGFFVSWHELTSAYPTLSQRVSNLLALKNGQLPARAKRHPLAYLFALFTLSGPGGGFSSLVLTVLVFALLLALALPAIEKAEKKARAAQEAAQYEEESRREKERVLAQGRVDSALAGTWSGGSGPVDDKADFLRWTTRRDGEGGLLVRYERREAGKLEKWTQSGQWRVLEGMYYELLESGDSHGYKILILDRNSAKFLANPSDSESTFLEIRVPTEE